jgi:hypothetical protein
MLRRCEACAENRYLLEAAPMRSLLRSSIMLSLATEAGTLRRCARPVIVGEAEIRALHEGKPWRRIFASSQWSCACSAAGWTLRHAWHRVDRWLNEGGAAGDDIALLAPERIGSDGHKVATRSSW